MTFPPFSIFICFNSLELFFSLHSSFSKTVRLPLHVFTSFLMSLQFLSIQNKSQFVVLDHDVLFYRPSPTLLLLFLSFLSPGNARTIEIHLYIYNRILIQHKLIYLHLLASGQQFRSNDFNKTCFFRKVNANRYDYTHVHPSSFTHAGKQLRLFDNK